MFGKLHLETESQFKVRESPAIKKRILVKKVFKVLRDILLPVLRLSFVGKSGRM